MNHSPTSRRLLTLALGVVLGGLVLFAAAAPALAQTEGRTTSNGLVQCSSTLSQEAGQLKPCDLCDLFKLINNGTFYAVSFLLAIATVIALVSGFLYVTAAGDEHRITQAKTSLKFAIVGFIFAMLAGIIVKTVVVNVFPGESPGLGTFTCQITEASDAPGSGGNTGGGGGSPGTGNNPPPPGGGFSGTLTDAEARKQLAGSGIDIKSGASLEGIRQSTIDGIKRLKAECPTCKITITSGTDGTHDTGTYSHGNGYKLDLRLDQSLTSYIRTNYTGIGVRKGDNAPLYRDSLGNVYAYEGDHWDVVYCYGSCSGGVK
ncbi:MAG: pilin [Candidatus Andersenbacteria bacterium]